MHHGAAVAVGRVDVAGGRDRDAARMVERLARPVALADVEQQLSRRVEYADLGGFDRVPVVFGAAWKLASRC